MIIMDVLRLERNEFSFEVKRLLGSKMASKFNMCFRRIVIYYLEPKTFTDSINNDLEFIYSCIFKINEIYCHNDMRSIDSTIPNMLCLLNQVKAEISGNETLNNLA